MALAKHEDSRTATRIHQLKGGRVARRAVPLGKKLSARTLSMQVPTQGRNSRVLANAGETDLAEVERFYSRLKKTRPTKKLQPTLYRTS